MRNNKAGAQFLHTHTVCTHIRNLNTNTAETIHISSVADTIPHFDMASHKSAAEGEGGYGAMGEGVESGEREGR